MIAIDIDKHATSLPKNSGQLMPLAKVPKSRWRILTLAWMLVPVSIYLFLTQVDFSDCPGLSSTATSGSKVKIGKGNRSRGQLWTYSSQDAVVTIRLSQNPSSCLIVFSPLLFVLNKPEISFVPRSGLGYWGRVIC